MNLIAVLLLGICVALETVEHLAFGMVGRMPAKAWGWRAAGVALHLVLLAVWFLLLKVVPLGIAMPLMGASYVTIALSSRVLFQEQVNLRRWIGIGAIVAGLALIGGA